LDPEDLHWLSRHCCCTADATEEQRERCARLRFRAGAALHKAGLKVDSIIDRAGTPQVSSRASIGADGGP
jgi:hypothetical protein